MRKIHCLSILLLLSAALAQGPSNDALCKLTYIFGAEGKTPPFNISNTSIPFCKTLNASCCSEADFVKMQKVWENPLDKSNMRTNRTNQMKDILNIMNYLKLSDTKVNDLVNKIKERGSIADAACSTPAFIQGNINKLDLITATQTQFNITSRKCWSYTKNLMNGLMCASCDHNAQTYIDAKQKIITISNKECSNFINACGPHIKSIQAVYFYFNVIYRLTYCSDKGEFFLKKIPAMVSFGAKLNTAINGCLNAKNKDDCAEVCKSQLGFTTMANYEYENREKLSEFMNSITKFLNLTNNRTDYSQTVKPETKRRVLPEVQKVDPVKELDSYKVLVSTYGLEFSSYTEKNKDNFEDIDMTQVYYAKIFSGTISILAILALLI